jgi:limonene-1,2-epoxide hydrolase
MKHTLPRSVTASALVFFTAGLAAAQPPASRSVEDDVMKVDEAYRLAKLNRDTRALDRILADAFNETNQNGNSRDKAETIELWKAFSISSLTTDTHQVRVAGDTATVTGSQTEDRTERMLFTRVYVKGSSGWQLLASMQFRNPKPVLNAGPSVENDVMKADEAFRLAKLNRDTKALDRILADGYYGTNQNGTSRDKAEMIELWRTFSISSLTTDSHRVRFAGDTAMVTGTQTEDGTERMLFTRVYVKGPTGWQLLSSMQYLDPSPGRTLNSAVR